MTDCPCEVFESAQSYECPRHGANMTPSFCRLYQKPHYRLAWDEGRGPGQTQPEVVPKELPPLRKQARTFVRAMAAFAGSGFRLTDKEEFKRRVDICMACPDDLFIRRSGRCRECGCYGKLKASGKVWTCPKGHWEPSSNP